MTVPGVTDFAFPLLARGAVERILLLLRLLLLLLVVGGPTLKFCICFLTCIANADCSLAFVRDAVALCHHRLLCVCVYRRSSSGERCSCSQTAHLAHLPCAPRRTVAMHS